MERGGGREHPEGPSSLPPSLSPSRMMVRWPVRERGRKEGDSTKIVKNMWEVLFTSTVFFFLFELPTRCADQRVFTRRFLFLRSVIYLFRSTVPFESAAIGPPPSSLSTESTHTDTHTLVSPPSPAASDTHKLRFFPIFRGSDNWRRRSKLGAHF